MSDCKACLERIEEKVDSNLNRMERMEARLETFGNHERIISENTQRIIQLENDSSHRRLTKNQVKLKTNSLYCLVLLIDL